MGVAGAALWLGCRDWFAHVLTGVEKDLNEKLRRLRVPTRHLHRYVIVWLTATGVICFGLVLALGGFSFGPVAAVFLLTAPWYLVRRMAYHRRQKI